MIRHFKAAYKRSIKVYMMVAGLTINGLLFLDVAEAAQTWPDGVVYCRCICEGGAGTQLNFQYLDAHPGGCNRIVGDACGHVGPGGSYSGHISGCEACSNAGGRSICDGWDVGPAVRPTRAQPRPRPPTLPARPPAYKEGQ